MTEESLTDALAEAADILAQAMPVEPPKPNRKERRQAKGRSKKGGGLTTAEKTFKAREARKQRRRRSK